MSCPSLALTDAIARGVTRCGVTGRPILSFIVDGVVVRYRLSEESVAFLAGALGDLDQIGCLSHSERSSGSPASDVSTAGEGEKV